MNFDDVRLYVPYSSNPYDHLIFTERSRDALTYLRLISFSKTTYTVQTINRNQFSSKDFMFIYMYESDDNHSIINLLFEAEE